MAISFTPQVLKQTTLIHGSEYLEKQSNLLEDIYKASAVREISVSQSAINWEPHISWLIFESRCCNHPQNHRVWIMILDTVI